MHAEFWDWLDEHHRAVRTRVRVGGAVRISVFHTAVFGATADAGAGTSDADPGPPELRGAVCGRALPLTEASCEVEETSGRGIECSVCLAALSRAWETEAREAAPC